MSAVSFLPKTARQRRRMYHGAIMNFRLLSSETNNAISIIDALMTAGSEPARHIHSHEDETFTIHAGEVVFFIGDKTITAQKGDIVFAPRGVAHHYKIRTSSCRLTMTMTPGNFDQYYWQLSFPYDGNELPVLGAYHSDEEMNAMMYLVENYGVEFI